MWTLLLVLSWKLPSHVISLLSYALFTGSGSLNASNTSSSHLSTKFSQLPNLHTFISSSPCTQRPRSTRSSSVVALARPPSSSSLKITDRSFRYASPCVWNQLPFSLRQPPSISCSPIPSPITSSSSDSPLCTSITPSLFDSRLKTYLFHKFCTPWFHVFLPDCLHESLPGPFLLSYSVLILFFPYFFFSRPCARWSWPSRQLLSAR